MQNHTTDPSTSPFLPIPELFRSDGDVHVIFLVGNSIKFLEQTEDAWYRGTALGYKIADTTREGSRQTYWPEEAASPLGCVQQFQLCNTALPTDKQCGPLASWDDAIAESAALFNMTASVILEHEYIATSRTASQFSWLFAVLDNAAPYLESLLRTLGQESLASKESLTQGTMGRLPSNQWQLDVEHWWSTYLAAIQAAFVETAIGPADRTGELEQYKLVPWNDHVQKLCNNQVSDDFSVSLGIVEFPLRTMLYTILPSLAITTRHDCPLGCILNMNAGADQHVSYQKILSSSYTSFSMFGLCFTYALGIWIIVASYVTGPICACLHRRWKYREYSHLEWTTNSALHYQRMAYQGINSGTWTGQMDDIPMTKHGEILAELPMRAGATVHHNEPEKPSASDQAGQSHENVELDSLIDSDDAADIVSLSGDSSGRDGGVATPAET